MDLPAVKVPPKYADCLCGKCLAEFAKLAENEPLPMKGPLSEGEDYYLDANGLMVFTEAYHRKRGTCCGSGCRHCPY